jgi:hypothetical protein
MTQARPMVVSNAPEAQRGRTHEPSQDLRYIVRLFVLIETLLTIKRSPATLHSTMVCLLPPRQHGERGLASTSISDWRKSAVAPPAEMDPEPPHPRVSH